MKLLLWLIYIIPSTGLSQSIQFRHYKKGEHFQYQLTTESFRNNQPDSKTISISHHSIVDDSGHLVEEIKWTSKKVVGKETVQLDSIAQKVLPYKISLMPGGQLKLPALTIPEMTGEITDLNTFYVAVSPALHVRKLDPGHLSFPDSVLKGNFADGKQIINGEDCIQVKQRLLIKDKKTTVVETSFLPPYYTGITPYIDTIGKQSFEAPNNFQMVRKGSGDKVNLIWGVERFIITTTLDNRTGMILRAEMINLLNLRMRYNSSPDFNTYDAEIPLIIKRVLYLELVK
jgi:hypothetical protein